MKVDRCCVLFLARKREREKKTTGDCAAIENSFQENCHTYAENMRFRDLFNLLDSFCARVSFVVSLIQIYVNF